MALEIAISFCPNDTFLFSPWISQKVGHDLPINYTLADLDQLNKWALEERFPLIKVSFSCLRQLQHAYRLLPVGAALGFHCGPKVIAKEPLSLTDIKDKMVALPGVETTAHLLFEHFCPQPASKLFCRYDAIIPHMLNGPADFGVIIHESRFTFQQERLFEVVDLGTLWENTYHLPLPLGCIVVRKDVSKELEMRIIKSLQAAYNHAHAHPLESQEYTIKHSQEKDWDVIQAHIKLYVNQETFALSSTGYQAIDALLCLQNSSSLPKPPKLCRQ